LHQNKKILKDISSKKERAERDFLEIKRRVGV
jgi:hypothetical protein